METFGFDLTGSIKYGILFFATDDKRHPNNQSQKKDIFLARIFVPALTEHERTTRKGVRLKKEVVNTNLTRSREMTRSIGSHSPRH
jgi:hypothetical protein